MRHYTLVCVFIIIALLIFSSDALRSQSWKTIITPSDRSFLYDVIELPNGILAVDDILGVWVTSNNGASWTRTLNTYNVLRMRGTNSLFALGGVGTAFIYVSNETGTTWSNKATDSIARPYVVEIAERSPTEFFALGTMMVGTSPLLYRTTNGGTTWYSASPAEAPYFSAMLAGPDNMLYGVHSTDGFYRSTDNGSSWTLSNSGITTSSFSSIVGKGQDTLFLPSSNGTLYRSTDKGLSWQSITSAFPTTSTLLSLHISSAGELYVATKTASQSTIYRSSDGGITWSPVGDPISSSSGGLWSIAITPRNTIVALVDYDLYTNDSTFVTTGVIGQNELPFTSQLYQNFPNPFNPTTIIKFDLWKKSHITLKVFDLLGRELFTLADEEKEAGAYSFCFRGETLSGGTYFYRLQTDHSVSIKKMILLK